MADEGNAEAAVPVATPPTPETVPLIDNEGNLKDGWTSILDEDLRDESYLNEAKTLQGIARSVVNARGMVGKDKIVKPTEASSDAEWDDFYVAGGRPDTAADYAFARPEEIPEEYYNEELATAAQELFHKLGISKKQADAIFAFNNNSVISQLSKTAQDNELDAKQLKDKLYADWGNAFEQKKHLGNIAVEKAVDGDEEFKQRLLQKMGNDPDIIRAFSNLGSKFSESSSPDVKLIPTPGDLQERIEEEMGNKAYGTDYIKNGFTKAQHQIQVAKVQRLFNEKMMSETKTG